VDKSQGEIYRGGWASFSEVDGLRDVSYYFGSSSIPLVLDVLLSFVFS